MVARGNRPLQSGVSAGAQWGASGSTTVGASNGAGAAARHFSHAGNHTFAVRVWLVLVALLVFAMIVVGGATRLTESGLSITEWQPLLGAIPPLSDADWQIAFEKYKQIPQYHELNKGMSLAAFKAIFWWEWAHRFLGRFIGVAFALPLAAFWIAGRIPPGFGWRFVGVLALGGLQGLIGWYMVKSGLADRISVSHYRLALHLGTAFAILAALVWLILELGPRDDAITLRTLNNSHWCMAAVIGGLVFLQVVLGAFVAGLRAGLTYNTWPLMDGKLVPDGLLRMEPWYLNLVENITTVQFDHRIVAYALLAAALVHALRVGRAADETTTVRSAWVLVAMLVAQAGLGIWTLLRAEGHIPLHLGLAHQGGAAIVLMVAVWHLHAMRRAVATSAIRRG